MVECRAFQNATAQAHYSKNTIQNEALSVNFRPFLSEEEIKTLNDASRILGSVKRKIKHAKEIKGREEKARDIHIEYCKEQRQVLLQKFIPEPNSEVDARHVLLWLLALSLHHREISLHGYFYEQKYFAGDIERAFGTKTSHTVLGEAVSWRREVTQFLEENLWFYDEKPDPDKIEFLQTRFVEFWRDEVSTNFSTKPLLERFDTEMAIRQSKSVHRI